MNKSKRIVVLLLMAILLSGLLIACGPSPTPDPTPTATPGPTPPHRRTSRPRTTQLISVSITPVFMMNYDFKSALWSNIVFQKTSRLLVCAMRHIFDNGNWIGEH